MHTSKISLMINNSTRPFYFRNESIGDKGVIKQIFKDRDYDINHWAQGAALKNYHTHISKDKKSLIIDAGANIGASSVFFSATYKNTKIFAIEPDEENFNLLKLNTTDLNCFNYHGAISNHDGELELIDPGRSDWGFMTQGLTKSNSTNTKKIASISAEKILSHEYTQRTAPLLFKIDIEGGEELLFSGNTNWIENFPLIIIELHDWMLPFSGSSRNFIKSIANHNFDLVQKGENLFLFNSTILKPFI